jgi:hypothetical protein
LAGLSYYLSGKYKFFGGIRCTLLARKGVL